MAKADQMGEGVSFVGLLEQRGMANFYISLTYIIIEKMLFSGCISGLPGPFCPGLYLCGLLDLPTRPEPERRKEDWRRNQLKSYSRRIINNYVKTYMQANKAYKWKTIRRKYDSKKRNHKTWIQQILNPRESEKKLLIAGVNVKLVINK